MRFCVRVPVLSEAITVVLPRFSTLGMPCREGRQAEPAAAKSIHQQPCELCAAVVGAVARQAGGSRPGALRKGSWACLLMAGAGSSAKRRTLTSTFFAYLQGRQRQGLVEHEQDTAE